MSTKYEMAKTALKAVPLLHGDLVEPALRMLQAAGVLDDGNGGKVNATAAPAMPGRECLTAIEVIAANEDNAVKVRRVIAEAKRLGFQIKANEKIDPFALDEALRGHPEIETRFRLKKNLAALSMLA